MTRETEKHCTIIQLECLAARWKRGNSYCFYDGNFCSCEICITLATEKATSCAAQEFVIMQAGAPPLYGMLELQTANVVFQAKENLHFTMELETSPQLLVGGSNGHRFV